MNIPAALLIAIFISLIKPALEKVITPDNTLHDSLIQLLAFALGIGGALVHEITLSAVITGPVFWSTTATGLSYGFTAIATYHLVPKGALQQLSQGFATLYQAPSTTSAPYTAGLSTPVSGNDVHIVPNPVPQRSSGVTLSVAHAVVPGDGTVHSGIILPHTQEAAAAAEGR